MAQTQSNSRESSVNRSPASVTERWAVEAAIDECLKVGRTKFRERYGFGKSTDYFVEHGDVTLDSKPVIAVAFGYQHKTRPLKYNDFSGGAATVEPVLRRLGFNVVYEDAGEVKPSYTSFALTAGSVYTRADLAREFGISDATLNNGVFQPKGTNSIWLFVTEEKSADRPQLHDLLSGDVLTWSGQPSGRTDRLIIDHLSDGNELLVFYRKTRQEFPGAGFRYEGSFSYSGHSGAKPASFTLVREPTIQVPSDTAKESPFDPLNLADGRKKVLSLVRLRQGQSSFRRKLLKAYDSKCAVTGCAITAILEAAHIVPYRGAETNNVTNGLLLRSDIHTLFDLGLITFGDDGSVHLCGSVQASEYDGFTKLRAASEKGSAASPAALKWHRENVASASARSAAEKSLS